MSAQTSKSVSKILSALSARAPDETAEAWDNTGLIVGDPAWTTSGAIVSVDLTAEAVSEAVARGYKLIVNHHPCIFPGGPKGQGLNKVTPPSLVFEALRHGIAVAAYHTSFDQCALEVAETISSGLGLEPRGRLFDKPSGSLLKLVVFVPTSHAESLRSAICDAGAGQIGRYDQCTFQTEGSGSFRGSADTHPFIGKPGELERADEVRLETVVPRGLLKPVLATMLKVHPYEEVAYDLYPVEQKPSSTGLVRGLGYGFWGEFTTPRSYPEVLQSVKKLFKVNGFLLTEPALGTDPKQVSRVGFAAGKGSSFVSSAASVGCDLFITGEVGYHSALGGSKRGMAVIELGHRESEKFFISTMTKWIEHEGIEVIPLDMPTQKLF